MHFYSALILIALLSLLMAAVYWKLRRLQERLDAGAPAHSLRRVRNLAGAVHVRDIMSKNVVTLEPEDSAKRAWRRLQEHKVKTLPVIRDGRVVGVIALVDFLKHLGLAWHTLPEDLTHRANIILDQDVATLMSKPAHTIPDDMPLTELAPLLSDTGRRHLPVVNADGMLVGIVTQSDLIAGLIHLLALPVSPE
jgi:CBS domain-containing membrane protein